jgi:hypothetical protein
MRTMSDIEKRASQRIHVEIPVYIGQENLVSRDVSREGLYFLSDHLFAEGGDLYFSLGFDFALPGKPIKFVCQGEVVRVEHCYGKFGIAAKINSLQLVH